MPLLSEFLQEEMEESEKIKLAIMICDALKRRGAPHGKLCPENIQFNEDGEIIFLDKEPAPKYKDNDWDMYVVSEDLQASDVYSLGRIFRGDFKLMFPPTRDMMEGDPRNRPKLEDVIKPLNDEIPKIIPNKFSIGKYKFIREDMDFVLNIDKYEYDENLHDKLDTIIAFQLALRRCGIYYEAKPDFRKKSFRIALSANINKPFDVWKKELSSAFETALADVAARKRLKVDPKHWEVADDFFEKNPKAIKYSKKRFKGYSKESGEFHSFVRIDGKIYALADGNYLGKGTQGVVKKCQEMIKIQNEDGGFTYKGGKYFAIKTQPELIEGDEMMSSVLDKGQKEMDLIKLSGDLDPRQAIRELEPSTAEKIGKTHKVHKIIDLHEGFELYSMLANVVNRELSIVLPRLDPSQKLMLALESCLKIQMLHDNRIIHGDIKAENMIADVISDGFLVTPVDYGSASRLPEGQNSIIDPAKPATPLYAAPEIGKTIEVDDEYILERGENRFSFASDNYALGMLFKMGFRLHEMSDKCRFLCDMMMNKYAEMRPKLIEVIEKLRDELVLLPRAQKTDKVEKIIQKVDKFIKEHRAAKAVEVPRMAEPEAVPAKPEAAPIAKPAPILPLSQQHSSASKVSPEVVKAEPEADLSPKEKSPKAGQ